MTGSQAWSLRIPGFGGHKFVHPLDSANRDRGLPLSDKQPSAAKVPVFSAFRTVAMRRRAFPKKQVPPK
jgi:hypothetical protein